MVVVAALVEVVVDFPVAEVVDFLIEELTDFLAVVEAAITAGGGEGLEVATNLIFR